MVWNIRNNSKIANFLFLVYAFYFDFIGLMPSGIKLVLIFIILLLSLSSVHFKVKLNVKTVLLVAVSVCFVLFRNQEFVHQEYMTTIMWFFCLFFVIISASSDFDSDFIVKEIAIVGMPHIFFTFIFWIFPRLYNPMYNIWGRFPPGVDNFETGYRAALTNHYSHNGIVCVFTMLSLFAIIISNKTDEKINTVYKILFLLSVFDVILTTKRAHLLFGIVAMLIVYEFCNPKKKITRTLKFLSLIFVILVIFYVGIRYIPTLQSSFSRFLIIGQDSESKSRFKYWNLAFDLFKEKPIFGIGWFGFRYQFNIFLYKKGSIYQYLNSHNVYIQLLCETGIVGLCIYLLVVSKLFVSTFKLLTLSQIEEKYQKIKRPLYMSMIIQVFYLLYSLTGNCLYDFTFFFYCIAIVILFQCLKYKENYSE